MSLLRTVRGLCKLVRPPFEQSRRAQRTASTVHRALAEGLARGSVLRDRVLDNGRAISVMQVEMTRDLHLARVFWEPMEFDASAADTARLQRALDRRRGVLASHVNGYLRQRIAPTLEFEQAVPATPSQRITDGIAAIAREGVRSGDVAREVVADEVRLNRDR
jgi:ribosome-binding factor A